MSNRLVQLEHQVGATTQQLTANMQHLNVNTQAVNASAQQLNEVSCLLKEQLARTTAGIPEANNLGPQIAARQETTANKPRKEGNPLQGVILEQDNTRRIENRPEGRQFNQGYQRCNLPRIDFPSFNSTNPTDGWRGVNSTSTCTKYQICTSLG